MVIIKPKVVPDTFRGDSV